MTQKLRDLFEVHGLMSLWKQRHFAQCLNQQSARFEAANAQVLGEERGSSWHWAWDLAEVAEECQQVARQLRALGESQGVEEWTATGLPLEEGTSHLLGLVALGALNLPAYYREGTEGGARIYVVEAVPPLPELAMTGMLSTVADAIQNYEFPNHKKALGHFVEQLGWQPKWENEQMVLCDAQGIVGIARFDDQDRLVGFKTRQPEASLG